MRTSPRFRSSAVATRLCIGAGTGANPNAADVHGRTPLHYCAHANCAAAFALVAEAGGQVESLDVEGAPLRYSCDAGAVTHIAQEFRR